MSFRSVDEQCGSEVSVRSVLRTVDEKRGSEVLPISVNQKCGSAVLLKLSIRSVDQKSASKVLLRKSIRKSVAQKCCSESVAQLRSGVSLRRLVRAGKSQLCSASLAHEVQASSSSWRIATCVVQAWRAKYRAQEQRAKYRFLENHNFEVQVKCAKYKIPAPARKSQLCSTSLMRKVQASRSRW